MASAVMRNRIPVAKRIRSGDLAEILATEYVTARTCFRVPLKRLRYKDDRDLSMRGDDVIGIADVSGAPRVIKVESKSRQSLSQSVVGEAAAALMANSGRPKPSTLAFISMMLRTEGRDIDAQIIEFLQTTDLSDNAIEHLIFTLSANDPLPSLNPHSASPRASILRHLVGMVVVDHQAFIESVFDRIDARIS